MFMSKIKISTVFVYLQICNGHATCYFLMEYVNILNIKKSEFEYKQKWVGNVWEILNHPVYTLIVWNFKVIQ